MRKVRAIPAKLFLCLLTLMLIPASNLGCPAQKKGPMLDQGTIDLDTPDFTLTLVRSSQTVAALKPKGADGFDFTPGDLLVERSQRWLLSTWATSTCACVPAIPATGRIIRQPLPACRSLPLPASRTRWPPPISLRRCLPEFPLQITRTWALDGGKLVLRFALKNKTSETIQVGALGIPMIFNNVLNNRSLEQAHAKCSFYDPYIGEDAGYLQVTRLNGHGPALLVVPDGKTPFEAYNPILDKPRLLGQPRPVFTDPTPRGITFEGFYDWMVHSQAYAENEWKRHSRGIPPPRLPSLRASPKPTASNFWFPHAIRDIEKTLAANARPVAVGIPGYVLPTDLDARLVSEVFQAVKSIAVEPTERSRSAADKPPPRAAGKRTPSKARPGDASRLTVTYEDGTVQTIHYFVIKPEAEVVADMGHFLTTKQWFVDPTIPSSAHHR